MTKVLANSPINQYDFHKVGLNEEFLTHFLIRTGFVDITRTDDFGFFKDTSTKVYKDTWISLNMIAKKPDILLRTKSPTFITKSNLSSNNKRELGKETKAREKT